MLCVLDFRLLGIRTLSPHQKVCLRLFLVFISFNVRLELLGITLDNLLLVRIRQAEEMIISAFAHGVTT